MTAWLGEPLEREPEAIGLAGLVERWLRAFGPGTAGDLKWWLGSTMTGVRRPHGAGLDAVEVDLERADRLPVAGRPRRRPDRSSPGPRSCLRSTGLRWAGSSATGTGDAQGSAVRRVERRTHRRWDGRIVGGWRQSDAGEVVLQLPDIGSDGVDALEAEAARLTTWFEGVRVLPRFPSPLSKAVAEAASQAREAGRPPQHHPGAPRPRCGRGGRALSRALPLGSTTRCSTSGAQATRAGERETDWTWPPGAIGSGAFLAGTASCRIEVADVDALFEELQAAGASPDRARGRHGHGLRDPRVRDPGPRRQPADLLPLGAAR